MKSQVVLTSETRFADCVTIDAQGLGRVFYCNQGAWETSIMGFTITGGRAAGDYPDSEGGGAYVLNGAAVGFRNCLFTGNTADGSGGAMAADDGSSPGLRYCTVSGNHAGSAGGGVRFWDCSVPIVYKCTLKNNTAGTYGGAVYCGDGSSAMITYSTLINNSAGSLGGGIYSTLSSQPSVEYSIVAFNAGNMGVYASLPGDAPTLMCCDIYGNAGGDWAGNIADQDTAYGNFSADPLFCDTTGTELYLETCSPCLAGYHPRGHDCGEVIGCCHGQCACGEATEPMTWGGIKALYR